MMTFTAYNHLDEEEYIRTVTINKEGQAIESALSYTDAKTAAFMDKYTTYSYENGNVVKIINNDLEAFSIQYDDQNLPSSFKMNMGFMSMTADRVINETGYRYNAEMVANATEGQDELSKMMTEGMADSPAMYILHESKDNNQHYTYIQEDKKSGEIMNQETFVRNAQGQLVETKSEREHKKYKYNKKGEIIEIEDVLSKSKTTNEVDKNGNIISSIKTPNTTSIHSMKRISW